MNIHILFASLLCAVVMSPLHAAVTDGLTVYYNFDNNSDDSAGSLDGNADTVDDNLSFASGHSGSYGPGLFGGGAYLGSGPGTGHAEAPFSPDVDGGTNGGQVQAITVQWWGKVAQFQTGWQIGVGRGEGGNWRFHRWGENQTMAWQGGGGDIHGGANVNDGQWHHFVGTSDLANNNRTLYIDGVVQASQTMSAINSDPNLPLMIGENPQALNRGWNGEIDDVAIWNRPLSADEVDEIYQGGVAGNSLEDLAGPPTDVDNDTLRDNWEQARAGNLTDLDGTAWDGNGVTPGPGAGTGDFDGDGRSDLQEYDDRTNPTNVDTDGDGIADGAETNTGTFVNASDTGTSPNNADSDGDGLNDGEEITQGADGFITNPTDNDTDGDHIQDGSDSHPTDPTLPEKGNFFAIEFFGPDDLFVSGDSELDPGKVVIAVNVFGNNDSDVNGVTFFTDRAGLGDAVTNEGVVTSDGVTVTSSSTHTIDGWSLPAPSFTGGTPGSAGNLSEIMADIRWSAAPSPLPVDIDGLEPGQDYIVDLLTYEGANRTRFWDISVNGILEFDNYSSEGDTNLGHTWGPDKAHGLRGTVKATPQGSINIIMQQQLGGDPPLPNDNNPILQAVIVRKGGPTIKERLWVERDGAGNLVLNWNSTIGRLYDIRSTDDPVANQDPTLWPIILTDIESTPPVNMETIPFPGDDKRFYVFEEKPVPPFFSDDFESGTGDWVAVVNDAGNNTLWELGTPSGSTGPITGADGSANAFSTNLGDYGMDSDISLFSPPLDFSGLPGAELTFEAFRDADGFGDTATVRFRRAGDDVQLGPDHALDMSEFDTDYTGISVPVPIEVIGENVRIEFNFVSDGTADAFSGLSIDDVRVDVTD